MNKITIGPECEYIYLLVQQAIFDTTHFMNHNLRVHKQGYQLLLDQFPNSPHVRNEIYKFIIDVCR